MQKNMIHRDWSVLTTLDQQSETLQRELTQTQREKLEPLLSALLEKTKEEEKKNPILSLRLHVQVKSSSLGLEITPHIV